MADKKEQEPSIEEILSSIRQIISDDDEEVIEDSNEIEEELEADDDVEPAFEDIEEDEDDDILELTDVVGKPEPDIEDEPEAESEPQPEPAPKADIEPAVIDLEDSGQDEGMEGEDDQSILTAQAAAATFQGFTRLTSQMPIDRKGTGSITLEDIVRELIRPMLREWMDVNLPPLIEKLVQKELDKIARQAIDE